jgi:hypothetical protein
VVAVSEVIDGGSDATGTGAPVHAHRLADATGVQALPQRPTRAIDAHSPDPAWLTT